MTACVRHMAVALVLLAGLWLPVAAHSGSATEAQALVAKAIELFEADGVAAFAQMNAANGGFRDRDLYVFVIKEDGTTLVHVDPARVGANVMTLKDVDSFEFGKAILAQATAKGAWVDYRWPDPQTGAVAGKSSWVVRYDTYVFGCGIYTP